MMTGPPTARQSPQVWLAASSSRELFSVFHKSGLSDRRMSVRGERGGEASNCLLLLRRMTDVWRCLDILEVMQHRGWHLERDSIQMSVNWYFPRLVSMMIHDNEWIDWPAVWRWCMKVWIMFNCWSKSVINPLSTPRGSGVWRILYKCATFSSFAPITGFDLTEVMNFCECILWRYYDR